MKNTTPVYLVKPGDPLLAAWKENMDMFGKKEFTNMVIEVPPDAIKGPDVQMMQELVMVMQHYPVIAEKFLFSVTFSFPEIEGSDLYFPQQAWKNDPAVQHWFFKMNSLPNTVFFINDSECRMFCIGGDLIAANKVPVVKKESGSSFMEFSGEQVQILAERLFTSCWFMMLYCHKTGFDPSDYIETLLAEFDLPVSFEEVKEKYEEDVEKGIQLRAQSSDK